MRTIIFICIIFFCFVSCGPSAEEIEKQRVEDSIKAEKDRLKAIEDADNFILNQDTTIKNQ